MAQFKTIEKIIEKKVGQWLDSIKDPELVDLIKNKIIVTGGCIPSMVNGESVNDFDIYFTSKEAVLAVAKYYANQFKERRNHEFTVVDYDTLDERERDYYSYRGIFQSGRVAIFSAMAIKETEVEAVGRIIEEFPEAAAIIGEVDKTEDFARSIANEEEKKDNDDKYYPVYLSPSAITLSDKIQLVIRFYGDPAEIHKNFDFVHCTGYWTSKDKKLVMTLEILECIHYKRLEYVGSLYPLTSIIRIRKFIKRGYNISAGEQLKIMYQISKLNLDSIPILEDQLIGIDVAYFMVLIHALKTANENAKDKGEEFVLTPSYLFELINRIFNGDSGGAE